MVFWYTGLAKFMLLMLLSRQFLHSRMAPKTRRMTSAVGKEGLVRAGPRRPYTGKAMSIPIMAPSHDSDVFGM